MKSFVFCATAVAALAAFPAFGQGLNATIAAQAGDFAAPLDATPDPDGSTFYFTAIGPNGPGVFRVAATGGPATVVAAGAPFVKPTGISISGDGRLLYIADPHAWAGSGRLGHIFVVPVSGGTPRPLRGAEGRGPLGIEVAAEGSEDVVYFTGYNAANRTPGVYKIRAVGVETPTTVFEGTPLVEPDSVAIGTSGAVYLTDRGANAVRKIENGAVSTLVERIRPGTPAGIALTPDESRVLVSTLQPYRNRAQVLIIDQSTMEISASTDVIGRIPGAGGLHRARNANIYAWCGVANGPIFRIGQ